MTLNEKIEEDYMNKTVGELVALLVVISLFISLLVVLVWQFI